MPDGGVKGVLAVLVDPLIEGSRHQAASTIKAVGPRVSFPVNLVSYDTIWVRKKPTAIRLWADAPFARWW
jgi:hypothetical protein